MMQIYKKTRCRLILAIFVGISLVGIKPLMACPMCSEKLADEPAANKANQEYVTGQAGLAKGFYYSILLMLLVPAATACGLGGMLYFSMKRMDPVVGKTSG